MTTIRSLAAFAATLIIALLWGGCKQSTPSGPVASLGSTSVTKYVAIGNSLTAGYQSGGLYESGQEYSYANLIAQQLKAAGANLGTFEMPWYSDPGSPDPSTGLASRYEILSMIGPTIGPRGVAAGTPTNTLLAQPYDDLGIPGAVIYDFLDTTDFTKKSNDRSNAFFSLVLRSSALGKSMLQQTVALNPDFITFWLGNNDVLGFATSGGTSPSSPTAAATFTYLYTQALTQLHAALPKAKIVVGNIPDVASCAYFTTVGPKIAAALPAGYYLRYQKHLNTSYSMDSTRFTESTPPLITLTGSAYASLIGTKTGKWYRDKGYTSIPTGIDTTQVFGLSPLNPWPDALVLDADEQATATTAVSNFNSTIATVAASVGAAVTDINGFLASVKANKYTVAGQTFSAAYISGGLFSLDGVHPSDRGYALLANQFIGVMNSSFGMSVPDVDIATIPGIPSPLSKDEDVSFPVVDPGLGETMQFLFGSHD